MTWQGIIIPAGQQLKINVILRLYAEESLGLIEQRDSSLSLRMTFCFVILNSDILCDILKI